MREFDVPPQTFQDEGPSHDEVLETVIRVDNPELLAALERVARLLAG
ncbi:MAG: hypothetical protein AB1758_03695 [Candidatus Eremiobacterota bacterium]